MRSIGNLFLFCFILWQLVLNSEQQELRPYRLIHADSLIARDIDDRYITDLWGNVHFFYGETEFFSDRAKIFEKQKVTKLIGNVKVFDDTLSLFSDKVDYHRISDQLFLRKNVLVKEVHSDSTIRTFQCEDAEYNRGTKTFFADKNVLIFDERDQLTGKCGNLFYDYNEKSGYMKIQPYLSITAEDTLTVTAEKIENFNDFQKIVAVFNVHTFSPDFEITSDFLIYMNEESRAIFQGEPRFKSEFARARAVEFQVYFSEQKIESAFMTDSCRVDFRTYDQEEYKNQVISDNMEFQFIDGKLDFCKAKFNVHSYFENFEKKSNKNTINQADGNFLEIYLNSNEEIESIIMNEKVNGKYKFIDSNKE